MPAPNQVTLNRLLRTARPPGMQVTSYQRFVDAEEEALFGAPADGRIAVPGSAARLRVFALSSEPERAPRFPGAGKVRVRQ